jgi:hypothetical protein
VEVPNSSIYEAGTSPLPPSASATLTQPEPSSSSIKRTEQPSGTRGVSDLTKKRTGILPVTDSSKGDVGVKSNRTRAAWCDSSCTGGAVTKEDGVGSWDNVDDVEDATIISEILVVGGLIH